MNLEKAVKALYRAKTKHDEQRERYREFLRADRGSIFEDDHREQIHEDGRCLKQLDRALTVKLEACSNGDEVAAAVWRALKSYDGEYVPRAVLAWLRGKAERRGKRGAK